MPGFLTPERRLRAKQRSRANHSSSNKNKGKSRAASPPSSKTAKPDAPVVASPDTILVPPRASPIQETSSVTSSPSPRRMVNLDVNVNDSSDHSYDYGYNYNYNHNQNYNHNNDYSYRSSRSHDYGTRTRRNSHGSGTYSLTNSPMVLDRDRPTPFSASISENVDEYLEHEQHTSMHTSMHRSMHRSTHTHTSSTSMNTSTSMTMTMYSSDEDMPMDELMGMQRKKQNHHQQHQHSSLPNTPQQSRDTPRDYRQGGTSRGSHRRTVSTPPPMTSRDTTSSNTNNPTYNNVTPARDMGDVLGLSNIMAMVTPSHWNASSSSSSTLPSDGAKAKANPNADAAPGTPSGIQRMIAALDSGSTACRPPNLTRDECVLWDCLQTAMVNDRNAHLSKFKALERDLQESNTLLDEVSVQKLDLERKVTEAASQKADMEHKYAAMAIVLEKQNSRKTVTNGIVDDENESEIESENDDQSSTKAVSRDNASVQSIGSTKRDTVYAQLQQIESLQRELRAKEELLTEQQESHDAEVLAIQRVLADVTTEKMRLEEQQQQHSKPPRPTPRQRGETASSESAVGSSGEANRDLDRLKEQLTAAQHQLETANREAERQLQTIGDLTSELNDAKQKASEAERRSEKLASECESSGADLATLRTEIEALRASSSTLEETGNKKVAELEAELKQRALEHEQLRVETMELQVANAAALEQAETLKQENARLEQQVEITTKERDQVASDLEAQSRETERFREEAERVAKEHEATRSEVEKLKKVREHAVNEVEKAILEAKAVKADHPAIDPSLSDDSALSEDGSASGKSSGSRVSVKDYEELKKTLSETVLSLETSKKIIASLENANGSLALDSRTKLKEKEEELSVVQKESEERKRLLDSLATELRDLQRKQGSIEDADRRTKTQVNNQKALKGHLESSLADLQEAVAIHECCIPEDSNLDEISEILGDTLHAVRVTLESAEKFVEEAEDMEAESDAAELSADAARHADALVRKDREARRMKYELDQKKIAVKRLEEALKKQNEEMRKLRYLLDARGRIGSGNENNDQLRAEIQSLRQQCTTNMEVLAKKERELSVLRSSLKVDENESGYISDDASDDEEDEEGTEVGSMISAAKLNVYGPADAEAYATILSQANGRIGMPGSDQVKEIEALKKDLMEALGEKESASKELQARRESLANAKMIISSLEQANKGMMEDLRSRLQDSNTAISSLLDKSKAHEKEANDLREQMQRLEQERREEQARHEAELRELRRETRDSDGKEMPLEEKKEDVPVEEH